MGAPYVFTFSDVLERLDAFARRLGRGVSQYDLREYVVDAYREIGVEREWSFYRDIHRITLYDDESHASVAFDLTGGTYERQLTTTGTWPSWAADASVRLGDPDIVCDVEDRKSDTVLTLDANYCPVEDISDTTCVIWPRYYRLPNDFVSMYSPMSEEDWRLGQKVSHAEIERLNRNEDRAGAIERYAIGPAPDLIGAMALYIHPRADDTKTLDSPYNRRQRDIVYTGHDARDSGGTISVTQGAAAVTGSSTAFESGMVNSILRIGGSTTYPPGGLRSQYPYAEQRVISTYTSPTSITLDANVAATARDVKYRITDFLDFDVLLYNAFLALCELNLARTFDAKNLTKFERVYDRALLKAKDADCRDVEPTVATVDAGYVSRLIDTSGRETAGYE